MAKPKRQEQLDELTDLEWDVERKPEVHTARENHDIDAEFEPVTDTEADESGEAVAVAETVERRAKAPKRASRPLSVVSYAIIFVAVALTTATLLILLT